MTITDVTSLTTEHVVEGGERDFRNPALVPDPIPEDAAGLSLIRQRAFEPFARRGLAITALALFTLDAFELRK